MPFSVSLQAGSNAPLSTEPGLKSYTLEGKGYEDTDYLVYLPSSYDGRTPLPLVVTFHGNGGTGNGEMQGWKSQAEKHGWILVCPTFKDSSSFSQDIVDKRKKMLEDLTEKLFDELKVDRSHVLATGFSGGGLTVWYVSTQLDDIFTALCFRSANFYGESHGLKMRKWRDRPIYQVWGTNEAPMASKENPLACAFLEKDVKASCYKHEIVPGGHAGRPELAAAWFDSVVKGEFKPEG